jgi:hypothetical protein
MKVIYRINNALTNSCYVGRATNYRRRKNEHFYDLRRNISTSRILQKAWNKYGETNFTFEVIEEVNKGVDLQEREQYWIDVLNPAYNIQRKAGSPKGRRPNPEQIEKVLIHTRKPIIQNSLTGEFLKEWPSIAEASRTLGINAGNIGYCCQGGAKTAGGFIFKFVVGEVPYSYKPRGGKTLRKYIVEYPNGGIEHINNLSTYCKEKGYNANVIRAGWRRDKPNKYNITFKKL